MDATAALSDEFLLTRLRRYCDAPLNWHLEDPCFLRLDVLRYAMRDHAEAQLHARAAVALHSERCGGCLANVKVIGATTDDPARREVYESLYLLVMKELIEARGFRFEITEEPTGAWVRMSPPPGLEQLLTGIEVFAPRDRSRTSVQVLKAASEAVFKDPRNILAQFDVAACEALQRSQQKPEWNATQWHALVPQGKADVFLVWRSESKELPRAFDLFGRYQWLMRKHGNREDGAGQALLDLRDLALAYNGRSPFASFAKTRREQRRIDDYRHERTDVLASKPAEINPELHGVPAATSAVEARIQLDRLVPYLSERERRVLELLRENPDRTDREIAATLGVCRETVNRDRGEIRRKAGQVLLT